MSVQHSLRTNAWYAGFGQGISMLLSILISLFVPKVLGVEQYGYWQLFMFYSSYAGLSLFGINDGLYLLHAGEEYDESFRANFKPQLSIATIGQLLIGALISLLSIALVDDANRIFAMIGFAVCMLLTNLQGLIGSALQTTNNTLYYAKSLVISKAVYFCAVTILLVAGVTVFHQYIFWYIVGQAVGLLYLAKKASIRPMLPNRLQEKDFFETLKCCRYGIVLTMSNVAGLLIMGISRIIVDSFYGIESFGLYSFAISIMSFVLSFVSQVSLVVYPALASVPIEIRKQNYFRIHKMLITLFSLSALLLQFGLQILTAWLPGYQESIHLCIIFLAACILESFSNLIYSTIIKLNREENYLLIGNIVSLTVAIMGSVCCVSMHASLDVMALTVFIAIAAKSLIYYAKSHAYAGTSLWEPIFLAALYICLFYIDSSTQGLSAVTFSTVVSFVAVFTLFIFGKIRTKAKSE